MRYLHATNVPSAPPPRVCPAFAKGRCRNKALPLGAALQRTALAGPRPVPREESGHIVTNCADGPGGPSVARFGKLWALHRPRGGAVRKVLFIFSVLSDGDVEWLAGAGERVHVDPGIVLIALGARVDFVYFVLDGQLAIRTRSNDILRTLEAGEIVGEMSLVDPAPTNVSVEVAQESTLLRISDAVLRDKLAADLGFASRFYRALCVFLADRMRHTTQRLGYGASAEDPHARDELNEELLDNVHLAGARFERMLKRLAG